MNAVMQATRWLGRGLLDFALPARCVGCGVITDQPHQFCTICWQQVEWLGQSGCESCGIPLEATDVEQCAKCLAQLPVIGRTRAAMEYGAIARSIVLRLKYSRKVALASTMARYMRPLIEVAPDVTVVPVPLHWTRMWSRGFNQSGLIAAKLARLSGLNHEPALLERVKRTRPLKNMSQRQRSAEVRAAFSVAVPEAVRGRRFLLVDDVLTSGSTSDSCAKALLRAGATRVDLICFARVVRPARLER